MLPTPEPPVNCGSGASQQAFGGALRTAARRTGSLRRPSWHLDIIRRAESAAHLAGVRCEESPGRRLGLTTYETYQGETWGKIEDRKRRHYAWYPIYDWSYTDAWTAIHRHSWPYCRVYDRM